MEDGNDEPCATGAAAADDGTRIDGRESFEQALQSAFDLAADQGASQLWLSDPDYARWPLGRPAMVAALARWAGPRRQLRLIAADYRGLPQRHPRWLQWRRQWAHIVQCLQVHEEFAPRVPCMLLLPGHLALQLHDPDRYRGCLYRQSVDLLRCREMLDALSQRADESFPATTLGL